MDWLLTDLVTFWTLGEGGLWDLDNFAAKGCLVCQSVNSDLLVPSPIPLLGHRPLLKANTC